MYAIERVIGKYIGQERGPMLLVFGAMHGNEPAGVEAIKMLFRALALEPYHNPEFSFKGSILGLIGNKSAYTKNVRFVNTDLNRSWRREVIDGIYKKPGEDLTLEEIELKEIIATVRSHIEEYDPTEIVMLDIHTTSSNGGIFTIASDDDKSMDLALSLKAPVVTKILDGVKGTSMHFFDGENMGLETTALCFEAGQHLDILSPGRAYAAIVNCLKKMGCVQDHHVENKHEKVLVEFSKNLPKVATLIYKHHIDPGINFRMLPGFVSFDEVTKGQHLADDINGPVYADEDGLILMPLYQEQGDEGYFVVVPEQI